MSSHQDRSLSRVPSNISLLFNPEKSSPGKTEPPGILKSLFLDPYWKSYTATWVDRADKVYKKQYQLEKNNIHLIPKDRHLIKTLYDEVLSKNQDYHQAKGKKKGSAARAISRDLQESVVHLESVGSASYISAIERQKLLESYVMISSRTSSSSLLSASLVSTQLCDLCVRGVSVVKVTNWFQESHKQKRIQWLWGDQQSGKSVFLHYIAKRCMEAKALAAGFVFSEEHDHHTFMEHFLPTILDQISQHLPAFKVAACTVCSRNSGENIFSKPIKNQVEDILVAAHSLMSSQARTRPLLIVLDGLDHLPPGTLAALFEFIEACITSVPSMYFIVASSNRLSKKSLVDQTEEIFVEDYKIARDSLQSAIESYRDSASGSG